MTTSDQSVTVKTCVCGSTGPFYKNKAKPDGLSSYCQVCAKRMHDDWKAKNPEKMKSANAQWRADNVDKHRAKARQWHKKNPVASAAAERRARFKKYGLLPEDFDALFTLQGGRCLICEAPMERAGNGGECAAVDHDHDTGTIRGILHNRCNLGLGHFKDDPALLRKAAQYLESRRK